MVDLTALAFCDARGLAALVRMAGYAEQMGCTFRLSSPRRSLVKIMRITGLHRRFLAPQVPKQTAGLRLPLTVQTGSGTKLGAPRLLGQPSSETGIVYRGAVMCWGWPIPE